MKQFLLEKSRVEVFEEFSVGSRKIKIRLFSIPLEDCCFREFKHK